MSLNSQNEYLCLRKPTNNGPFFLTIAILVVGLLMARMETDCNFKTEAKLFKLFPRVFEKSIFSGHGLFSLCELGLYLPVDVKR